MNGKTISEDIIVKDLGVYFTNDLKFHQHICKIIATGSNSRLEVIRNNIQFRTQIKHTFNFIEYPFPGAPFGIFSQDCLDCAPPLF